MSDLYWTLTLGDLHNFFVACLVISIGMFICFFYNNSRSIFKRRWRYARKIAKYCCRFIHCCYTMYTAYDLYTVKERALHDLWRREHY